MAIVWMGSGCRVCGGGERGEGSEGAGAVVVDRADEEGSGGVVDGSEPGGGESDSVTSAECEDGSD